MSKTATTRPDWADDVSDSEQLNDPTSLPAPVTTVDKDGVKTTVLYRFNDAGQKVKVTRKTRTTTIKEKVNPAVAERREWSKFGNEKGKSKGPQQDTTSVGENISFRLSRDWKSVQAEEAKEGGGKAEEKSLKEQLKDKKVKCRICQGEHFTARCPFKDTMAPADDGSTPVADPMAEDGEEKAAGGLGVGGGGYVPPHMRKGGAASAGERMGGKYERDDLATLRVTNVSYSQTAALALLLTRIHRSPKWQKNKNSAISSSASAASRASSSPKTERLAAPRALHSSALSTEPTQVGHAKKWTVLATGI